MMKKYYKYIVVLVLIIAFQYVMTVLDLVGSDDTASQHILSNNEINIWIEPFYEPSDRLEQLLFGLQAVIGVLIMGVVIEKTKGKKNINDVAILVVSFGTTFEGTREKTIDQIFFKIKKTFSDYHIYEAYTSKMVIRKLKSRDGIKKYDVPVMLKKIYDAGHSTVYIVVTHLINGKEYDIKIMPYILKYADKFASIKTTKALLTTHSDYQSVISVLKENVVDDGLDTAHIFIGHGTHEHEAFSVYPALNQIIKKEIPNGYVCTIEGYPLISDLKEDIKKYKKAVLYPLMFVAGDHAVNDIGSDDDSIKSYVQNLGITCQINLVGLGEIENIQDIYIEKLKKIMEEI